MKYKRGEGEIVSIIIIGLIIWGAVSFFGGKKDSSEIENSPNYDTYKTSRNCNDLRPDNPYSQGSGHYAGFEWGESGKSCGGNSSSFIEGCEEYDSQETAYQSCLR